MLLFLPDGMEKIKMKDYRYWAKIALFEAFLIAFDQLSKYLAILCLKGKNDFEIIPNVLCFHYLDGGNTGAAWGMFAGKTVLFIVFTLIAIVLICKFMSNTYQLIKNNDNFAIRLLNIFMALLMAGAVGNLIDRIAHNYVIDFIYFKLINFPIFNVADCYVTISCIFIIILCSFKINEDEFNQILSFKK